MTPRGPRAHHPIIAVCIERHRPLVLRADVVGIEVEDAILALCCVRRAGASRTASRIDYVARDRHGALSRQSGRAIGGARMNGARRSRRARHARTTRAEAGSIRETHRVRRIAREVNASTACIDTESYASGQTSAKGPSSSAPRPSGRRGARSSQVDPPAITQQRDVGRAMHRRRATRDARGCRASRGPAR